MFLTVVIPIYNSAQYLKQCIDSIVEQPCEGVELILVDDGSTDGSPEICDAYAKRYDFIKVVHQTNLGRSGARNRGIEMAAGEWIAFVDSDDYVAGDYIGQIGRQIEPNVDFLLFEAPGIDAGETAEMKKGAGGGRVQYYDGSKHDLFVKSLFLCRSVMDGCEIGLRAIQGIAYRCSMLRKNHILFQEGVEVGEDLLFNLQVSMCFCRAKCVDRVIYYYVSRADSIMNRYKPHYDRLLRPFLEEIDLWLAKYPEYEPYHSCYRLHDIIMYMKYDFFHRKNQESGRLLHRRMKKILLEGRYREDYRLAKQYGVMKKSYPPAKRFVFWAAVHGHFRCLRWIAYLKYGRKRR